MISARRSRLPILIALTGLWVGLGLSRPAKADICSPEYQPYVGILRLWSSESEARARVEMVDLLETRGLEIPWQSVAQELLDYHDPGTLSSVVAFHVEVHNLQARMYDFIDAAASRHILEGLTSRSLERNDSLENRQFLGHLWASVAFALRQANRLDQSRLEFLRAHELDPSNEALPLAVASILEKEGEYRQARDQLAGTLGVNPENYEGWLRWALISVRLGKESAAAEVLARLAEEAPDWISILAYQEWVQILASLGDTEEALAVAQRARERYPDNTRIAILTSYLLGPRNAESRELLEQAGSVGRRPPDGTPRARYNRWPEGAEATTLALETLTPGLRADLASVLDRKGCR